MSVDILELDLPSPNVIPDEVIPNLNMLRLEVLHRVERDLDGTFISICFIVTPNWHPPEVDFLSTLSPAQSESEYPTSLKFDPGYHKPKFGV